jgi:hypothetical protein
VCIALTASSTGGDDDLLIRFVQIPYQFTADRIPDDRSDRHLDHPVFAGLSMLIFTQAVLTTPGLVLLLVAEVEEGSKLRVGQSDDIAALSPVAAVRASPGNKFLPAKTYTTATTVAGDNANFHFVDKLHGHTAATIIARLWAKKKPRRGAFPLRCSMPG